MDFDNVRILGQELVRDMGGWAKGRLLSHLPEAAVRVLQARRNGVAAAGPRPEATPEPVGVRKTDDRFERAVLARYGCSSPEQIENPTVRMWLDFALSSVARGRETIATLGGTKRFQGKRVLDVGCAYAGFLVAAREAGAAHVAGVDINPELLELARKQLADHGIDGHLDQQDIMQPDAPERLGTYDIVLCNDVIEHVKDPVRCAENLSRLLAPGGRLFLHVPNAQAVDFLHADGHYGLFGLTLLSRSQAESWWRGRFGPGDTYGVEHYGPLSYYLDSFSAAGLSLRLLDMQRGKEPEAVLERLRSEFERLQEKVEQFEKEHGAEPGAPATELARRCRLELARFRELSERYQASDNAAERRILFHELVTTYDMQFWKLEGIKV